MLSLCLRCSLSSYMCEHQILLCEEFHFCKLNLSLLIWEHKDNIHLGFRKFTFSSHLLSLLLFDGFPIILVCLLCFVEDIDGVKIVLKQGGIPSYPNGTRGKTCNAWCSFPVSLSSNQLWSAPSIDSSSHFPFPPVIHSTIDHTSQSGRTGTSVSHFLLSLNQENF